MSEKQNWRNSREYRFWRVSVIRRDGYCKSCGTRTARHAHHIKSASYYPELRFDISNGVTLCRKCHSTLHNVLVGGYRKKCTEKHYETFLELRDFWKEKKHVI